MWEFCELNETKNAGGSECITGEPIDVSICERSSGEENSGPERCTLRFREWEVWPVESGFQDFTHFSNMRMHAAFFCTNQSSSICL